MAQVLCTNVHTMYAEMQACFLVGVAAFWNVRTSNSLPWKSKFHSCMHRYKCFCYSEPLKSILFVAFLRIWYRCCSPANCRMYYDMHVAMWQCGVYLCHVCDVILFRLYFGIRKLPAQFVIIILELLHCNKQNSHFSSSRWYQINFLIIIIASLPLLSVFSYFRSIVRSFIISFSSLHIPVSILFIHMPSITFYWLYTVTASHTYICTFIELYSTYSQPPGQTIVNKQNNERTSAVIMQKATTNAIKQLIWWCAVCMANVSESLCVSVSMPISRDDIHTDSNLIMQCIQRTPLLPVFQSLDEMYTHKHTLCSAEFHHRHKCVQTLHKYTWTVGTTGGKMRLKTVRQKRNPRMRMCQGKINKKKMYAIIS